MFAIAPPGHRLPLHRPVSDPRPGHRLPRILAALLLASALLAADPAGAFQADDDRVRFALWPHASHGMLVFSYQGDLWIGEADGTGMRRLTSHVANDVRPRFSPDGRHVAFTSNRSGTNNAYVVPVEGGEPRQLTFHPTGDNVQYWTPDGGGVVISSSRGPERFRSPLYVAPLDGSIPTPLPMDAASSGMIRQDGRMVAFNRKGFSLTRRGYLGNNAADVWVQDLDSGGFRQLTNLDMQAYREEGHNALPMWGADGMVYFISEANGPFNIWRVDPEGGEPEQVTFHTEDGIQYPSISPDGRTITYTNEFDVWTLGVPDGEPRRVEIRLRADPRAHPVELHSYGDRAEGFSPSPDGSYLAVDVRGRIFLVPSENGVGEKIQVTDTPWRDRFHSWSPDGRRLAYVSDESGDEEVWVYDVATGEHRRMTTHASMKSGVEWGPDSRRFAFAADNRLFLVDVESGGETELAHNPAGGYALEGFSPDGEWLVYNRRDEDMNREVYLFEISRRSEVNVTHDPFNAQGGVLTPDQTRVVFRSNRDGGTNHLFVVSLARMAEDPNDPLARERRDRGRTLRERAAGAGDDESEETSSRSSESPDPAPIHIDEEGIDRRAIQLTSGANAVGTHFLSADGETVYFTSSDSDGAGLFAVDIDGRNRRRVAQGSFPGITPSADRRYVFFRGSSAGGPGSEVHRMTLQNQRRQQVRFELPVWVDVREEWRQIFEESWRVMRYRFYDEAMHGTDWEAIREKYRALLPHVSTYDDLYSVANKMLGELNASHLGVSGPPSRPQANDYRARYLGFEMEPGEGGRYRVSHVYREGPADREWLDIGVGDYVLALDGQELRAGDNYWRVLTRRINEYVTVRVADAPDGQGARDLRMATVGSLNQIRYEEWVQRNRELVEEESGGRIAYVHIQAMNQPSLRRFENEINQFWNAEGIVVDVRFNGGGNIDQQIIDILERRPYQFWNSRWGAPTWGRRPRQAIAGPKVMLINHRSGSDAEVTPLGFQQLGLGRLVGNPTAGAVIATGSYGLIHGGSIRTPGSLVVTYDPTQPDNHGVNLENLGVAPDVWVENTPEDELAGFDRELRAAVEEAMRMLREEEAARTAAGGDGDGGERP